MPIIAFSPFVKLCFIPLPKINNMDKDFPLHFTLEDGTHVTVNKTGEHIYDFILKDDGQPDRHFTINDNEEFTEEKEKTLDFDQLNALRKFWLETRNED